uniref:TCF3 fusion partner n=1 Tax=Sus scrofa TaxID=9823 RepID=A0A4X1VK86_PIG
TRLSLSDIASLPRRREGTAEPWLLFLLQLRSAHHGLGAAPSTADCLAGVSRGHHSNCPTSLIPQAVAGGSAGSNCDPRNQHHLEVLGPPACLEVCTLQIWRRGSCDLPGRGFGAGGVLPGGGDPSPGGSYRCCYRRLSWGPGVWSHPSDTLELLVTDELPRPSLVALPGPVVAPWANVSLRCAGRVGGMSFALYRVGVAAPLQYRRSAQPWADFPLPGARAPGTYSCYYHTPSAPYVLSQRSEPLVISADGSGSSDYTQGNVVRLGLAGLVLAFLGTLVVFDWRSRSRAPGSMWA